MDLGAYHPMKYNNTYLLYKLGWRGINIDLNQTSIDMFNIVRKEDTNICTLISDEAENEKTIYFEHNFSAVSSLNFSEGLNKKMIMKTNKFDNIVKDKFDFLNIDLEDHDYQVLKTIDLNRYQPSLICIEILEGSRNKENIYDFMKKINIDFYINVILAIFLKEKKNMKIIDCFMYFDEDHLLEIRLNTLFNLVDKFVIVEADLDHAGNKRIQNLI